MSYQEALNRLRVPDAKSEQSAQLIVKYDASQLLSSEADQLARAYLQQTKDVATVLAAMDAQASEVEALQRQADDMRKVVANCRDQGDVIRTHEATIKGWERTERVNRTVVGLYRSFILEMAERLSIGDDLYSFVDDVAELEAEIKAAISPLTPAVEPHEEKAK